MAPEVIHSPDVFRERCDQARDDGARVALVPTMGALHAGHLALVTEARRWVGVRGFVVVSIFVNPTQFGPDEDLAKYPRELDADVERCASVGVDVVFAPDARAMYPDGDATRVRVPALAEPLCGAFRPGHFEGVATVVAKLFGLTGPCLAVFGRKDYQQWKIVQTMARDLFVPVEVVGHPIVREADGLAMSSRNRYLSPTDRARAVAIPQALTAAANAYANGLRDAAALRAQVETNIRPIASSIDYVDLRDAETLAAVPAVLPQTGRVLLAVALRVGTTRLIDNVVLGEDTGPLHT